MSELSEFEIELGVPEIQELWTDLLTKNKSGTANADEVKLYNEMGKAMKLIASNPRHPGLETHEIKALSKRCGVKVWQSYLENKTPKAGRIYWSYGPKQGMITIIGVEPHPNDKSDAYDKVTLSRMSHE